MVGSNSKKKSMVLEVVKGTLGSVSLALVLILLFAVLIRFTNIPDAVIKPVNQVIKVVCILFGVFLTLKGNKQKGWLKGLIVGALFALIAYTLFAILGGTFTIGWTMLVDVLFSMVIGALSGVIVVNVVK